MNAAEYVIMGGLSLAGPEKLAIVCGDECLTYGAVSARVSQFAAGCARPGMGRRFRAYWARNPKAG
jgi:hypothetical protein